MIKPIDTKMLYCQKVLPLVYDDSLSYYEMVCKLTSKMNEIILAIDDNFESYIKAHFNELMINSLYDEETETITLSNKLVGDGEHIYLANTNTMKIV